MNLSIIEGDFSVCKMSSIQDTLSKLEHSSFFTITKTNEELSLVCESKHMSNSLEVEKDWKLIKVEGPLDFSLTGILSSIAQPLAEEKISIFAISTFNTDYILVKNDQLKRAQSALETYNFHFL